MPVPAPVPFPFPMASDPAAAAAEVYQTNIHDLKVASMTAINDSGDMSDNDDIAPSSAAVQIPWAFDSFLDTSSDEPMEPGSFEGPEKLLEIHFSPRMQDVQHIRTPCNNGTPFSHDGDDDVQEERYGLRIIPKAVWEEMLDIVQCKVLHSTHTHPSVDAYVLSESSFFVFPHKLMLKTCGTTTLLMALPKILELAQTWCGLLHSPSSTNDNVEQQLQQPYRVFYSRKKFLFPEKQVHVHREWKDEVEFLDRHFNNGSAYTIGKVNGDHWCLYVTAPFHGYPARVGGQQQQQQEEKNNNKQDTAMENFQEDNDDTTQGGFFGLPPTRPLSRSSTTTTTDESEFEDTAATPRTAGLANEEDEESYDQTIEILMTDLNPKAMHKFYHHADKNQPSGSEGGQWVDQQSGLAALFPEAEIDSFLFQPCGYSCNALVKPSHKEAAEQGSAGSGAPGKYFTIHVTPEPVCSYASFETNIPVRLSSKSSKSRLSSTTTTPAKKGSAPETVNDLIQRVIDIFQPGNLTVTLFVSSKTNNGETSDKQTERRQFKMLHSLSAIPGFRRTDRILYGLDGYDLIYGHYLAV